MNRIFKILIISLILSTTNLLVAQEDHKHHSNDKHHEKHGHGHHFHKHHVALFMGASTNFGHDATLATIGIDYEYRFVEKIGAGAVCEYLFDDKTEEIVAGICLVYHPIDNFKILAGPLYQNASHKADDSHEGHGADHGSSSSENFGLRVGAGYDFHLGKLSITPTINSDFIDGATILVYGLGLGLGF